MPTTSNGRRPSLPAGDWRQFQLFHAHCPVQQAQCARLRQLAVDGHAVFVIVLDLGDPVDDRGVAVDLQAGDGAGTGAIGRQVDLDVAQAQRQGGIGIQLEDAERRRGELGQRRIGGHLRFQRKQCGIGQRPAIDILELVGQRQRELRFFRERRLEHHAHHRFLGIGFVEERRLAPRRAIQQDAFGQLAADRRAEVDPHRQDRRAGGVGVFALAAEAGGKLPPHLEVEQLLDAGGQPGRRGDADVPHQPHGGAGRQALLALHGRDALRLDVLGEMLQQVGAHLARHQRHRNPFLHPFRCAIQMLADAGLGGGAVLHQHEHLFIVDFGAAVGKGLEHGRAAGLEAECGLALEAGAGQRLEARLQRKRAARAGRQVAHEIVDPVALVGPAAAAGFAALDVERRRRLRIAEPDGRLGKGGAYLAHFGDFVLRRKAGDGRRRRVLHQGKCGPQAHSQGKNALHHLHCFSR